MKTRTQLLEEALDAAKKIVKEAPYPHYEFCICMCGPTGSCDCSCKQDRADYEEALAALSAAKEEPSEATKAANDLYEKRMQETHDKRCIKYRKKPIVIEAVQYVEYGKLVTGMCNSRSCYSSGNQQPHVHTIHDNQIVNLEMGDYIIPEPDGIHFYPCKPDIFEMTYSKSEEDTITLPSDFYNGIEWFACWLLDHVEGDTITEESLRPWAAEAWRLKCSTALSQQPTKPV